MPPNTSQPDRRRCRTPPRRSRGWRRPTRRPRFAWRSPRHAATTASARRLSTRSRCRPAGTAAPHGLGPATRHAVVPHQGGAADGRHVRGRGGVAHAIPGVAGPGGDRHAGMVVVMVIAGLARGLAGSGVAVGHVPGAQGHRFVHRRAQAGDVGVAGLDQQDVAAGADRRHHVHIQGLLLRPAMVGCWVVTPFALLVDHLKAPIGGVAHREAVLLAVDLQVRFGPGVAVGVNHGDVAPLPAVAAVRP